MKSPFRRRLPLAAVLLLTLPRCASVGPAIGQVFVLRDAPAIAMMLYTHCIWLGGVRNDELALGQVKGSFRLTYAKKQGPPELVSLRTKVREAHGHDPNLFRACDQATPARANALLRRALADSDLRFSDTDGGPLETLTGDFFPFGEVLASASGENAEPLKTALRIEVETTENPHSNRYRVSYRVPKAHWWSGGDRLGDAALSFQLGSFEGIDKTAQTMPRGRLSSSQSAPEPLQFH
jgi:hypothetical protein